jgi:uroporphyrinogen-III synthase
MVQAEPVAGLTAPPVQKTVIITRPLAQADALARQVAALGRAVRVLPLLEIHPLADPACLLAVLADLDRYALVAFVSPNAIDACFAHLSAWPVGLPIAVMGEGSRAALAAHGVTSANARIISPQDPERTDSSTLLAALDVAALHGKQVLILRGESGRELLADALRAAGINVVQVAAYRRAAPVLTDALRAELMVLLDCDNDWIVTSSEALRILMQLVQQLDDEQYVVKMRHQHLIVPHARIAETAQLLGFDNLTLTRSGDERLLAALQSSL